MICRRSHRRPASFRARARVRAWSFDFRGGAGATRAEAGIGQDAGRSISDRFCGQTLRKLKAAFLSPAGPSFRCVLYLSRVRMARVPSLSKATAAIRAESDAVIQIWTPASTSTPEPHPASAAPARLILRLWRPRLRHIAYHMRRARPLPLSPDGGDR
jgi:hypothetical protein